MNSKQRFAATCQFRAPDRTPVDYLAHYETDAKLRAHLGCQSEEELLDRLGSDFYYLSCRDISQNEGFIRCYKGPPLDMTETERTCTLGIRWRRKVGAAKFSVDEAIAGPLEKAETEAEILRLRWPTAADFDFSGLQGECQAHANRVIIGGLWSGLMGDSFRLHGFQNFLTNIALKPQLIHTLLNRVTDMYLELNDALFAQLKGRMDVWFFGSDFGTQNGLLMRSQMWHEFFFEPIRRLVSLAHSYGLRVMMHSCGGIAEIIPHLIEAGVEILDPIQLTARGMEPDRLAGAFGGQIVFHGGVDTQRVLPYGTPDEVVRHAAEVARVLGSKGGYIFAPSQILGPDIPVENILAMYRTLRG
jgi:uroporphyrinogen decarboxylase